MSVRTYDPRPIEIFPVPLCSKKNCGKPYSSICKVCNLAYCFDHLKLKPHSCRNPYDAIPGKPTGRKKKEK